MNRKIVVAVDGSAAANGVLSWALDQADATDEVVALSVWNLTLLGGL
ncbi:MAG: universal stress protein, partial [Acidimicrobiales bacterium]